MAGKDLHLTKEMPFLSHIRELRKRLIFSLLALGLTAVVCFYFYEPIVTFLFRPFLDINRLAASEEKLFINSLFEGFLTRIKVSFYAGLTFSLPFLIYQVIRFVFPGLTNKEQKVIGGSLISSAVLLLTGFYYSYYLIIPVSVKFLTNSGFIPANVGVLLNFKTNIFYIFQFLLSFVVLFQVPVVLVLLMLMKLVRRSTLLKASRYVIVAIFLLAAIITPPDFISQLFLGLPLIVLFFLAILIAKIFRLGDE